MKPFRAHLATLVLVLFTVGTVLRAAEPGFAFTGVMSNQGKSRVAVKNTTTGESKWLGLGELFAGYTINRFDPASDTLVVTKDGIETKLPLVQGKTQNGERTMPADAKNQVMKNLRQLAAAADQYFLEHGVTQVTYDQLVGPEKEKYIRQITPVDGEDYRSIPFTQGGTQQVRTSQGFVVSFGM